MPEYFLIGGSAVVKLRSRVKLLLFFAPAILILMLANGHVVPRPVHYLAHWDAAPPNQVTIARREPGVGWKFVEVTEPGEVATLVEAIGESKVLLHHSVSLGELAQDHYMLLFHSREGRLSQDSIHMDGKGYLYLSGGAYTLEEERETMILTQLEQLMTK